MKKLNEKDKEEFKKLNSQGINLVEGIVQKGKIIFEQDSFEDDTIPKDSNDFKNTIKRPKKIRDIQDY